MIHEFYAVTRHSVYHVKDNDGDGFPFAEKIGGKSPIGKRIEGRTTIAIAKRLISYNDPSQTEGAEAVKKLLEQTSTIVALFKDRVAALECSALNSIEPCDLRWIDQTREVVNEIGENHPTFEVCRQPNLALLPN